MSINLFLLVGAGIFLLSGAVLLLQLGLTRIFSVAQWYHFAFMVISLALLGFGASGSYLALRRKPFETFSPGRDISDGQTLTQRLCGYSLIFSLTTLSGYLFINHLPFDSYRITIEPVQFLYLALYYLALSLPFFFAGLGIGSILSQFPEKANIFYFFNLFGSGLGCLLATIIPLRPGEASHILSASILGCLSAIVFWFTTIKKLGIFKLRIIILPVLAVLLLISLGWMYFKPPDWLEINISPYKTLSQVLLAKDAKLKATKRNAFSRIDIISSSSIHYSPGLSYIYTGKVPEQLGLCIDGENLVGLTQFSQATGGLEFVDYLPDALAFYLAQPQISNLSPKDRTQSQILIINPRAGLDVLSVLYYQPGSVTVVEDNPLIIKLLQQDFQQQTGGIYNRAEVQPVSANPRSYVRGCKNRFDLIIVSLSDSFAPVTTGAFSLTENYLYTVEAVEDYLSALRPGGILCLTRWLQTPASESLKLGGLIINALENSKFTSPQQHLIAFRTWATATYLIKKLPFSSQELKKAEEFCQKRRFDLFWMPNITEQQVNRFNVLSEPFYFEGLKRILNPEQRKEFFKGYEYDIRPVTDSRPFFFHFFRPGQLPSIIKNLGRRWQPFAGGGYLVIFMLLVIALLASILFILLPLYLNRYKSRGNLPNRPGRWRLLIYFLSIGFGFMFIEIALMHQFILSLWQPIYAFACVLASIMVFSGLGSFISGKWTARRAITLSLPGVGLVTILYGLLLPGFIQTTLGLNLAGRLITAVIILIPLSLLMGVPFPSGIRLAGSLNPGLVPWLWAVNGFGSVIGAIAAAMLALSFGYQTILILAGIFYLMAGTVMNLKPLKRYPSGLISYFCRKS